MEPRRTSCIIPFWNEDLYLFRVLDEIIKVRNLDEIICVDDASDEDKSLEIETRYPGIKLIRLEKNLGKSGAIREGLKHAKCELILLLDADLRNLCHKEIGRAVAAIKENQRTDMLILRRINANPSIRVYRGDILFTGERIIKKADLEVIINGSVKGWQLESAINSWMYEHNKIVYWMPHSGINTQKPSKWGFLTGIKFNIMTFADIISASGVTKVIKQIMFFAKDELKPDNKFQN